MNYTTQGLAREHERCGNQQEKPAHEGVYTHYMYMKQEQEDGYTRIAGDIEDKNGSIQRKTMWARGRMREI